MSANPPSLASIFDVPEYAQAGREFFDRALQARVLSKSPLLAGIMGDPVEAIPDIINTTPAGDTVRTGATIVETEFGLSRTAGIDGDFDDLYVALDTASDAYVADLVPKVYSGMGAVLEAFGQVVSGEGKDTATALLESLELVEWVPDETGTVRPPEVHTSPQMAQTILALPESFGAALDEMGKRKQAEYDARRRTRRLPRQR